LPLVTTSHGMITEGWLLQAKTWLNLRCLRFAQEVIASSAREARLLEASGHAARVRYIPNGIVIDADGGADEGGDGPPVRAEFGFSERAPILAFVGRLAAEKRVDVFLESAALVALQRPDARFLVIGSGVELERSRDLAVRLGIAKRVRFTGLRWDVARLLTAADVLVCSSDTEGTPRAVLEAMACGAVVVATAVGGVPDLVEDGQSGLLVTAGDAAALARASIVALNPERAAPLRAAARKRVLERHSVAEMAAATEAVYSDAVRTFTPPPVTR
jgi:glycosyltransferase involved in cell wall biosynthesis